MMRPAWLGMLLGLLVTCWGCGGDGIPKAYPVSGVVTYQGKPVEGAEVTFSPAVEDPKARAAGGKTDAQGKFTLKTYYDPTHELGGAILGDYLVTITKKEAGASQEEMMKAMQSGKPVPMPKDLLPAKYALPQQSGLKQTVSASTPECKFELTD